MEGMQKMPERGRAVGKPIGPAGLALIKQLEGCRLRAYKPISTEKYWTIGWGHCGPDVWEGQTITQPEADRLLEADCQRFADAVDDPACCPQTALLNENQRDALISFAYNCGEGCLKTLCKGRTLSQIRDAMALYSKAGGKVLPGLERRRRAEQALFDMPVTPAMEKHRDETMTYQYLNDVPEKFRPVIEKLMTAGILQGDGNDPVGNGDVINLTHEQVRTLMFVYRGGGFDARLRKAGLTPAVDK